MYKDQLFRLQKKKTEKGSLGYMGSIATEDEDTEREKS